MPASTLSRFRSDATSRGGGYRRPRRWWHSLVPSIFQVNPQHQLPVGLILNFEGMARSCLELTRVGAEFGPQADALLHVDDMAVLGEPVNESRCQVSVLQKAAPVGEAQIGSDQRRLFAMPFVHQREEKPDLNRFDLYVADFVN